VADKPDDRVGDRLGDRVGDRVADNAENIRQEDANRSHVSARAPLCVPTGEDPHSRRESAKPGLKTVFFVRIVGVVLIAHLDDPGGCNP